MNEVTKLREFQENAIDELQQDRDFQIYELSLAWAKGLVSRSEQRECYHKICDWFHREVRAVMEA